MRSLFLIIIFVAIRLLIILLAILLGYYLVRKVVEPYVLHPNCLTDTNSCAYLTLWKYENSFIAQAFPSGLFMWFNGTRLYVYGEDHGTCSDPNYESVNVITISGTNQRAVYHRLNYECITTATQVIQYYTGILKVNPVTIYIRGSSNLPAVSLNVFDIFQRLVDDGIVSINNIKSGN